MALAVGLLYSTLCDASCTLFGCSAITQAEIVERSEQSNHCEQHEQATAADETQTNRAGSTSSNGRREELPDCLAHVSTEALLPATINSASALNRDTQFVPVERLIHSRVFSDSSQSFAHLNTSFRSPPALDLLSVLRI